MIPEEHREFLEAHRLAVFGIARGTRAPALTPVYYVVDGDELLVSTTESRFKARAVRRNPAVSLCVLHEEFPFPYLTVFGEARVEREGAVDLLARISERMSGTPVGEDEKGRLAERAEREGRVVLRVRPERFVRTAPRARPRDPGA